MENIMIPDLHTTIQMICFPTLDAGRMLSCISIQCVRDSKKKKGDDGKHYDPGPAHYHSNYMFSNIGFEENAVSRLSTKFRYFRLHKFCEYAHIQYVYTCTIYTKSMFSNIGFEESVKVNCLSTEFRYFRHGHRHRNCVCVLCMCIYVVYVHIYMNIVHIYIYIVDTSEFKFIIVDTSEFLNLLYIYMYIVHIYTYRASVWI